MPFQEIITPPYLFVALDLGLHLLLSSVLEGQLLLKLQLLLPPCLCLCQGLILQILFTCICTAQSKTSQLKMLQPYTNNKLKPKLDRKQAFVFTGRNTAPHII